MSLDKLTDELIDTLEKFNKIDLNKEARDYWVKQYSRAREYFGTKEIHCIDCASYCVANRYLAQYYDSIMANKEAENGQRYLEFSHN